MYDLQIWIVSLWLSFVWESSQSKEKLLQIKLDKDSRLDALWHMVLIYEPSKYGDINCFEDKQVYHYHHPRRGRFWDLI